MFKAIKKFFNTSKDNKDELDNVDLSDFPTLDITQAGRNETTFITVSQNGWPVKQWAVNNLNFKKEIEFEDKGIKIELIPDNGEHNAVVRIEYKNHVTTHFINRSEIIVSSGIPSPKLN